MTRGGEPAAAPATGRLSSLSHRRRWVIVGALLAGALLAIALRRDVHGLAMVVRAAGLGGVAQRLADLDTVVVSERLVAMPADTETRRARVYAPAGTARQTVLLVSGLHPAGIDEPRLVALARRLAEANVTVVTPEVPELTDFEITPRLTDRIERAAEWLATDRALSPSGRIGLIGISFSGGLSIVAAGRPSLKDRLLYVLSFGGHDDLRRVLRYFCTGAWPGVTHGMPPGVRQPARPPHDYGVAVVLLNVAERVVPPIQLTALRHAVRRFLWASYLDRADKPGAEREFAALRDLASTLPEPSATLLGYVNNRDVAHLGPVLLPHVDAYVSPPLSPAESAPPTVPVYLLHGRDDNVIPAAESQSLADRLRGRVPVRLLVTDLISHAEADQPAHLADILQLGRFWGALLDQEAF